MDFSTVGLGPDKPASLQSFCEQPEPIVGRPKQLHEIAKPHDIQHTDHKSL
jgi:hypothetical protein